MTIVLKLSNLSPYCLLLWCVMTVVVLPCSGSEGAWPRRDGPRKHLPEETIIHPPASLLYRLFFFLNLFSDWVSFLMFDVLIFFFIKINTFHSHEGLCVSLTNSFIHSFGSWGFHSDRWVKASLCYVWTNSEWICFHHSVYICCVALCLLTQVTVEEYSPFHKDWKQVSRKVSYVQGAL